MGMLHKYKVIRDPRMSLGVDCSDFVDPCADIGKEGKKQCCSNAVWRKSGCCA